MPDKSGMTVRELLPSRLEHLKDTLRTELTKDPDATSQGSLAWGFLKEQAADYVGSVLNLDIFEILAGAWCKARKLREYTDQVKHPPGKTEVVVLGEHKFTHTLHPVLEYTFGERPLGPSLRFDLDLIATIRSITVSVRDGYITAVGGGSGHVELQLAYKGKKLHDEIKSRELPAQQLLQLKAPGIKITSDDS
jgi:hypothetical protein